MSGLETLPPDQRAVLQLILVQGRGYEDLATTLKLDPLAVRERAHAGAAALVGRQDDMLDAATRGRVVDYLLGQQDEGERIVTFAELGDAPDARRWAQALRERLAGVAREPLPEVPAGTSAPASPNGSAAHGATATAVASPARPPALAPAPAPAAAHAPATGSGEQAPPPELPPSGPAGPAGPRPSRLGGAILIAGAAALAIVLAIVLIGGGGGGNSSTSGNAATTQARTQASTSPTGTTAASRAPAARPIAAAVLRSPSGGAAIGAGIVQAGSSNSRLLAVEAARLAPNGTGDIYAIWLQGSAGNRFMGFVPNRVGSDGTFTVSANLPRGLNLASYATLLVTREGTTAVPSAPGTIVLSGQIRSTG